MIFARYLLSHLPQPEVVVARWATLLAPGGRLVSFRPADADVAQLFLMNLDAQGYDGPLRAGLLPFATQTGRRSITWRLRQGVRSRP